jgi:dienelactone hydrolase
MENHNQYLEKEIEFQSEGITCRGLFVRPNNNAKTAPLIILSHGLGGVYEMRLDAFARRFAEAGYAALTFDYRFFGRSDGHPRHWLVKEQQQQDIENAISFGRTLEGVDPKRIILWGTSLAGGHMIDVSSRRKDISATIIQGPFTDGIASALAISIPSVIQVVLFAIADAFSRVIRRKPVLIPLAGTYGTPALMTNKDVVQSVLKLFPHGSKFSKQLSSLFRTFAAKTIKLGENISTSEVEDKYPIANFCGSVIFPSGTVLISGVSAIFGIKIVFWSPWKNLSKLSAPMLVCVCEHDSVAPAKQTIKHASKVSLCDVKVYPYGHFDIYTDEPFEVMVKDQLAFLNKKVPLSV